MIDLLVRNADWLITMDAERRMVRDGALAVDGGEIKAVGRTADVTAAGFGDAARVIDARNRLITPGFIDNHQHLAPFFVRGLGDDVPLNVFLHDRCYPMEAGVTDEEAYLAAMCALLESVRHGTTTRCDPGSQNPENSARAVDELGCRAVLARSIIWDDEIGSLEAGKRADFLLFDLDRPEWVPLHNPLSNLCHGASGDSVHSVVIDGKVIVEDGEFADLDARAIMARGREAATAAAERTGLAKFAGPRWPVI